MKSFLLDTNILIGLFGYRTAPAVHALFSNFPKDATFYLCGLVLGEFYQGIDQKDAEYFSARLERFPYLHSAKPIYEQAGLIARELQKKGKNIALGDCLIAQTAKYYKMTLVTFDKDFRHFPGLLAKIFPSV